MAEMLIPSGMYPVDRGLESQSLVVPVDHLVDRLGQAAAGRDLRQAGEHRLARAFDKWRGGEHRGHPQAAVDSVAYVADRGIAPGVFGGELGMTQGQVAIGIRPDLRADPFAKNIAVNGRFRRSDSQQEIAVSRALGGPGTEHRQVLQPEISHILGGEIPAVLFQDQHPGYGIINIVIPGHALDGVDKGPFAAYLILLRHPVRNLGAEIVLQRVALQTAQVAPLAFRVPALDRFAQQAAGDPAQPGAVDFIPQALLIEIQLQPFHRQRPGSADSLQVRGLVVRIVFPRGEGQRAVQEFAEFRLTLRQLLIAQVEVTGEKVLQRPGVPALIDKLLTSIFQLPAADIQIFDFQHSAVYRIKI